MYDFIVLGLVPGTRVQITFFGWLVAALTTVGLRLILAARRRRLVLWLRLYVALFAMPLRITPPRQLPA